MLLEVKKIRKEPCLDRDGNAVLDPRTQKPIFEEEPKIADESIDVHLIKSIRPYEGVYKGVDEEVSMIYFKNSSKGSKDSPTIYVKGNWRELTSKVNELRKQ